MPAPLAAPLVLGLLAKGVGTKAAGLTLAGAAGKTALAAAPFIPSLLQGLGGDPLAGVASAGATKFAGRYGKTAQALTGLAAPMVMPSLLGGAGNVTQAAGAGLLGMGGLLPDLEIGPLKIGERARRRGEAEFQRGEIKKDLELQQQLQGQYLNQTLAPFLDQQRRAQVTAQQSLLNTQGAIYQKLARTAGNYQLAGQGIQANTRLTEAALTQNPYSGSVISAPNITFGRG